MELSLEALGKMAKEQVTKIEKAYLEGQRQDLILTGILCMAGGVCPPGEWESWIKKFGLDKTKNSLHSYLDEADDCFREVMATEEAASAPGKVENAASETVETVKEDSITDGLLSEREFLDKFLMKYEVNERTAILVALNFFDCFDENDQTRGIIEFFERGGKNLVKTKAE